MADRLSCRPDLELNGIEFSLDVHQDIAKQVSAGYENDSEFSLIIKRLTTFTDDAMLKRYL